MRKLSKIGRSKRGAMALQLITIFGLLLSLLAFMTLKVMEKPATGETRYIGEHQIAIMNTGTNAEKFMLFVDQAAKPSAKKSLFSLAERGGYIAGSGCGQYLGYEIWMSSEQGSGIRSCIPDEKTMIYQISDILNNELYKYLEVYWGGQNPSIQPIYSQPGSVQKAPSATAAAVMAPPTKNKYASRLPLGMLGSMPPNNYNIMIEQQKDQLKLMFAAKEKAEFDIIVSVVKRRITNAAEAVTGAAKNTIEANFGSCSIQVPTTQSHSIGTAQKGRLENGAEMLMDGLYANVYTDTARNRGRNYGTNDLVVGMQKWGCALKQKYNIKLAFGDMSDKNGGGTDNHASHTSGRDVDLGLIFKGSSGITMGPRNAVQGGSVSPDFDLEANWFLLETIFKTSDIYQIYLDTPIINALVSWAKEHNQDPKTISMVEQKVKYWAGHQNHYHVRIMCPKGDSQCIN